DVAAHAVVDATAGKDDFRVVANGLCLVRQVVRIDADAVAADQAGTERQEVPFGAGGCKHVEGVDTHAVEDHRQFVDQGNVEVALGVLDDVRGFGHPDAARLVRAGGNHRCVKLVDQ